MKIVITGSSGLLGWHLRCRLSTLEKYRDAVFALDRLAFDDDERLHEMLNEADVVIHCAGINRASDEELEYGNIALAKRLVEVFQKQSSTPHLIYANSIQCTNDSPYGRGKSGADKLFSAWAKKCSAPYTNVILPHIFGECGKPFYNSVVFTFCRQLIDGESLNINANGMLELIHAQDVSLQFIDCVERSLTGTHRLKGEKISVPELAGRLSAMHDSYRDDIVPDLRDRLSLQLFNTLRSFFYPDFYPGQLVLNSDERGTLFEAVKNRNGGQAFLSTTKPGITRGNHFHFSKVERFLVVRGQAVIRIRRLFHDEVKEFYVSGDNPVFIDMPCLHTHNITNIGNDELMTLFWSHEIFDPEYPDTYFQPVQLQENVK